MKLYAGGFARFFLGDWDHARLEAEANDDGEEAASPDDVRKYFEAFRDALATDLAPHGNAVLTYNESGDAPHASESVPTAAFSALLIIAARAAVADKRLVPINRARDWFDDPAVVQIQEADSNFKPIHHLVKADSWLPADFDMLVESEVPERDLILGSLPQLQSALADIGKILHTPNEVTRKLSPDLLDDARRGHAAFATIVGWATTHRMPILIDP